MHPAKIKAALAVAGFKQVDLAREIGVKEAAVSNVINGRSRSKQIEDRIAEITRLAPETLWPQWYGEAPLVLTSQERELVLAFRAASSAAQRRALRDVGANATDDETRYQVTADRGGIAAGRDVVRSSVHESKGSSYRKK